MPREEGPRGDPGARRRAWVLGTLIALIGLAVGAVFGDRGLLNLVQKRQQIDELRQQIDTLRGENAQLASDVAALRTSPRAIERVAREQLGLARPDETVFLLHQPDASAH
ncbi:MAG TPA: septum formation initiator family protein [Vicinamibacteria bacterium]|nr:septum formation initiator family protein [Vicinamibacteria bacterium]